MTAINEWFKKNKLFTFVLTCTFMFGFIAHGYCYFNLSYSHDSLLVYQNDAEWQISLGRFLHPLYFVLRGNFYTPWLVGALSLLFLGIAAYMIIRLLDLKNPLFIFLTCGILSTNYTITLLNATYIHDVDIYMLALLLVVWGVYLMRNRRRGSLLAVIPICLSLGLYQSFFQAAIFLIMILEVKDLLNRHNAKQVFINGLQALISLLLSLILYSIILRVVLFATGTALETGYNGLSRVGHFDGLVSTLLLFLRTYRETAAYFLFPPTYRSSAITIFTILLFFASCFLGGYLIFHRKIRGASLALLLALTALMPFGMNVIFFLSHGMEHHLMVFSFFLAYAFALLLLEMFLHDQKELPSPTAKRNGRFAGYTIIAVITVTIFNSIIYAGQTYLKKQLEYQNTLFTMVRVVDRIEQTDGYVCGETPVALVGSLNDSSLSVRHPGRNYQGTGNGASFSVTYYQTYLYYFHDLLTYPINLIDPAGSAKWAENPTVQAMPVFPAPGSCRMIDGVMVIRLS